MVAGFDRTFSPENVVPGGLMFYYFPEWADSPTIPTFEPMLNKTINVMDSVLEGEIPEYVSRVHFEFLLRHSAAPLPERCTYSEGNITKQNADEPVEYCSRDEFREFRDYFANRYPKVAGMDGFDYEVKVVYKPEMVLPATDLPDFPDIEIAPERELECQRMTTLRVDRIKRTLNDCYREVVDRTVVFDSSSGASFEIDSNSLNPVEKYIRLTRVRMLKNDSALRHKRDKEHDNVFVIMSDRYAQKETNNKVLVSQGYTSVADMFHRRWDAVSV